jgi:hypothetical protein
MALDPTIISSTISAVGGILAGFLGGKGVAKHQGDKRCERIAALMVNGFDKLLTALEITGEPPEMRQAIREARDVIAIAKGHLGYISGADSTNY